MSAQPHVTVVTKVAAKHGVFDFRLDADDLAAFAALDDPNGRIGPNPLTATF
jgi:2,5-diketo-D-gluconate reductase A